MGSDPNSGPADSDSRIPEQFGAPAASKGQLGSDPNWLGFGGEGAKVETAGAADVHHVRGDGTLEARMEQRDAGIDPSPRLPRMIWVLGIVSLFMDTSSELVHSLLPILMTTTLGASMVTVGLIEGVAEATASIAKVFSGTLSDAAGSRKWLVVAGYGLAAITKPVFPLAPSVGWVFGARFVDRVGKGIRGAPRDALVADVVPAHQRGAAYGLRQALDSIGAFVGPAPRRAGDGLVRRPTSAPSSGSPPCPPPSPCSSWSSAWTNPRARAPRRPRAAG